MDDLINRKGIVDKVCEGISCNECSFNEIDGESGCLLAYRIDNLTSAESEIIHCENCKWWEQKFDDSPMGYCMAAKHNYYSTHWEINIRRTYGKNFFCADAEPKEGEEE